VNSKPQVESHQHESLRSIPAVLLVGGLGTRLQSVVRATPKPLAPVGDAPFLEIVLQQLRSQGVRDIVMCTGHLASQVEEEFGDGSQWGISIEYSREASPLGTAGALKRAAPFLAGRDEFFVMNGDSFLELNLGELLRFHRLSSAVVAMAVRRVPDAARYGTVQLAENNRVSGFREKDGTQMPGLINGGVYVFSRSILACIPDGPASLEKEIFPSVLQHGVYALEQRGMFIDIGTPEDYARAQSLYQQLCLAAQSQAS